MSALMCSDLDRDLPIQDSCNARSYIRENASRPNDRTSSSRNSFLLLFCAAILFHEGRHVDAFLNQNFIHNRYHHHSSMLLRSSDGPRSFGRLAKVSCPQNDNNIKYHGREIHRRKSLVLSSHFESENDLASWEEEVDDKAMRKKNVLRALGIAYFLRTFVGINTCLLWGSSALTLAMIYKSRESIRERITKNIMNKIDDEESESETIIENDEIDELSILEERSNKWVSTRLRLADELDEIKSKERLAEIAAREKKRIELSKKWAQEALRASEEAIRLAQEQRERERQQIAQIVEEESLEVNKLSEELLTH